VIRPPADTSAAARRIALGLALMFALSPDTRFGYFAYPIGLCGWIALSRPDVAAFLTGFRDEAEGARSWPGGDIAAPAAIEVPGRNGAPTR